MPEDVTADGDLSFDEWRRDLLSRVDTPTAPAPLSGAPVVVTLTLWPTAQDWPQAS